MKRNFLDNVISIVSPGVALDRVRARMALDVIEKHHEKRNFEGAGRGRRFDGWQAGSTSATGASFGHLNILRDRARDLVRNDPNSCRAVSIIASNVVGTGIIPQPRSSAKKKAALAKDLWNEWGETTLCDFDDNHDFYGIQSLAMRCIAESGEVILRRRRGRVAGSPIPLQIQILEPDFIDSFKTSFSIPGGGYIIQGVEFSPAGKKVAYWLYDRHPGDVGYMPNSLLSKRVVAEDIIHLFRIDRAGQVRGITWSAPVILKTREFNDFEGAHLLRQKIAACFTAFIHDSQVPLESNPPKEGEELEKVEPGLVWTLPEGKSVTFGNPPGLDGYADFSRNSLSSIARGWGIPYELLSGDYSNVNFASGRLGLIEFSGSVGQWRWNMLIPRGCNRVWSWFTDAGQVAGYDLSGVTAKHTPPKRTMINPVQEIAAQKDAVRSGLQSLSETIRENGDDPETVFAEIKSDNEICDRYGLILDSDPRKITNGGMAQIDPGADPNSGQPGGNKK